MDTFAQLVSLLFASRTQAHTFHLQTTSFAVHKTLNEYYDGIIELVDELIESYQGKHGLVTGYTSPAVVEDYNSAEQVIEYFTNLADVVEQSRKEIPQDDYLLNQIDEITALVYSTVYKLKFLK